MMTKITTLIAGVLAFTVLTPLAAVAAADTAVEPVLVKPSPKQLKFADWEVGTFICFSMSTFSGDAGDGYGQAKPSLFNPTQVDARQWVRTAKEMGAKYAVFITRHTDGFCMWPSAHTTYSVKSSPWKNGKGDAVREFMDACKEFDIEPCLYFWTMSYNDLYQPGKPTKRKYYYEYLKSMSSDEREKLFKRQADQLTEVITRYRPKYIWFDHWCAPNFGMPELSTKLTKLVMELDPECIIWGSEVWHAGDGELAWASYPSWNATDTQDGTLFSRPKSKNSGPGLTADHQEVYTQVYTGHPYGKFWRPMEAYTTKMLSLRWFWVPQKNPESTIDGRDNVNKYYYRTVGLGMNLLLNLNPDKRGIIPDRDVVGAKNFGDELRRQFAADKLVAQTKGVQIGDTIELRWEKPRQIDRVVLMENIVNGQKVAKYTLEALVDGQWQPLMANNVFGFKAKSPAGYETIGHKKIDRVKVVTATGVRFRCVKAVAGPVEIRRMAVYAPCD